MRAAMFVLLAALAFPSADSRAQGPPRGWDLTGRTQAATTAEVRARVTGHLTRVAVKEGDAVAKGDLLVEIDPRPYRLALDAARARVKVAEAKLTAAKVKAANTRKLAQDKVVSRDEVTLNLAAEAEAEATLLGAQVEVQRAELTLSWARVTAPFNGRVSRIQASEGSLVTAEKTPILKIVSTDPLYVSFNVPEAVLLKLRRDGLAEPGKLNVAVGFAGEEGHAHVAKLDLIEPEVDAKTGTVRFRATVPNPKGLLSPGMSARVRLSPAPNKKR
jgi:multidrug efflux system membrane fusion protein